MRDGGAVACGIDAIDAGGISLLINISIGRGSGIDDISDACLVYMTSLSLR